MVPGSKNEALAGDLLEQFSQGRSATWYWRQAAAAIFVGLSKQLLILWIAGGFTVAWIFALNQFYGYFWVAAQNEAVIFTAARYEWTTPLSYWIGCFTAFNALPVALALSAYLGLTKILSARRFVRGLSAGLLAMAIGMRFCFPYAFIYTHRTLLGNFVASLPLFGALIIAMWAGRPTNAERRPVGDALT
jgi:hypothetical protein